LAKRSKGKRREKGIVENVYPPFSLFSFKLLALYFLARRSKEKREKRGE